MCIRDRLQTGQRGDGLLLRNASGSSLRQHLHHDRVRGCGTPRPDALQPLTEVRVRLTFGLEDGRQYVAELGDPPDLRLHLRRGGQCVEAALLSQIGVRLLGLLVVLYQVQPEQQFEVLRTELVLQRTPQRLVHLPRSVAQTHEQVVLEQIRLGEPQTGVVE